MRTRSIITIIKVNVLENFSSNQQICVKFSDDFFFNNLHSTPKCIIWHIIHTNFFFPPQNQPLKRETLNTMTLMKARSKIRWRDKKAHRFKINRVEFTILVSRGSSNRGREARPFGWIIQPTGSSVTWVMTDIPGEVCSEITPHKAGTTCSICAKSCTVVSRDATI